MAEADRQRSVLVAFRVAPDLREAMQRAAEDESRSLSNWIMVACKKALAERNDTG
jgi:hypothetical protein